MWISADPALAKFLPNLADQIRADREERPFRPELTLIGLGGVFNAKNINLYGYAQQNPIKLVDPDGRTPFFPETIETQLKSILPKFGFKIPKEKRGIIAKQLREAGGLLQFNRLKNIGEEIQEFKRNASGKISDPEDAKKAEALEMESLEIGANILSKALKENPNLLEGVTLENKKLQGMLKEQGINIPSKRELENLMDRARDSGPTEYESDDLD